MGTRYIVVVVLRNSGFAIDHCHGQGEKHEERRDGTRGIASRTEHRHETFHTAGSLIIVCPSYLTTYTELLNCMTLQRVKPRPCYNMEIVTDVTVVIHMQRVINVLTFNRSQFRLEKPSISLIVYFRCIKYMILNKNTCKRKYVELESY
ncbi:uncharacterized protein LOC122570214 isoform X2 [Bombus pyrosoma]|uniref:uncharacterized protein LOC122570214 isoform X2 n=1 Tax=Bombus pyrosoma TaxID=396416 RepID=UPI001CB8EAF8|nr:uncharacterized protein LOC122570214 isoform X2 [Bombus pyrosoma]